MDFAVKHPVSVLSFLLGVALYGSMSLARLPMDRLPRVIIPEAVIICEYPGLPAEDMENLVTMPLEQALSGIPGAVGSRSVTMQGTTRISITFGWDTDTTETGLLIREAADRAYASLPEGAGRPYVEFREADGAPAMEIAFFTTGTEGIGRPYDLLRRDIIPGLYGIEGVASVRLLGVEEPEIKVAVDREKAAALGLSTGDITRAVSESLFTLPLGTLRESTEHRVVATTDIHSAEDIARIPLLLSGGYTTLSECADIYPGTKKSRSLYCVGDRRACGVFLYKVPGYNSGRLSRQVRQELERLNNDIAGMPEHRILQDASEEISKALASVIRALVTGALASLMTVFLVYRDIRAGIIIGINLPASLLPVFSLMELFSLQLNTLSLLGMAVGTGMVVDNAIVVLEQILESSPKTANEVSRAVRRAGGTVLGSTVSSTLVFLPVLLLPGLMGALFRDLILAITLFLGASCLWAALLTPALYMLLIHTRPRKPRFHLARFMRFFFRQTGLFTRRSGIFAVLTTAAAVLCTVLIAFRGPALFPERTSRYIEFEIDLDPNLSAEAIFERMKNLSTHAGIPAEEILLFRASSGYDVTSPMDRSNPAHRLYHVRGVIGCAAPRSPEDALRVARALGRFDGCLRCSARLRRNGLEKTLGKGGSTIVTLGADTRTAAEEEARQLEHRYGELYPGADIRRLQRKNLTVASLHLDYEKLSAAGTKGASVLQLLQNNIDGSVAAVLREDQCRTDVRVLLGEPYREHTEDLLETPMPGKQGFRRLKEGAVFVEHSAYPYLLRIDRNPALEVELSGCEVDSKDSSPSVTGRLGPIFAAAVILLYLCLVFQFETLVRPLLMLSVVPAVLCGSLAALTLGSLSLNLFSGLGILIATGTSLNMVILVSENLRTHPRPTRALRASFGGVFTSTVTTLTALTPLFFLGDGPDIPAALAGGLLLSAVYTLTVYPGLVRRAP